MIIGPVISPWPFAFKRPKEVLKAILNETIESVLEYGIWDASLAFYYGGIIMDSPFDMLVTPTEPLDSFSNSSPEKCPPNGFIYFRSALSDAATKAKLSASLPSPSGLQSTLSGYAGRKWRQLSASQRDVFNARAKKDQAAWKKKMAAAMLVVKLAEVEPAVQETQIHSDDKIPPEASFAVVQNVPEICPGDADVPEAEALNYQSGVELQPLDMSINTIHYPFYNSSVVSPPGYTDFDNYLVDQPFAELQMLFGADFLSYHSLPSSASSSQTTGSPQDANFIPTADDWAYLDLGMYSANDNTAYIFNY
ncbi:hypothetical protein CPB83DRAFT_841060 [Crepidotus variabilis]|uniref:HMG box domain-containing protein n=1 Tax=Crepidotus variabilis TaxID=179855 RepID=A0A9P6E396_9AGAR|nr:hypothetical protein CPB83DRAFT_841052 [Crepidotus variabilis]KAF9521707.1 hypothetical protein CPB83DRAFT_841060 [Crepidotus variabilis]